MADQIKCSYDDCKESFETVQAMKKHKKQQKAHPFYCKRCDENCDEDEDFLLHQIISPKHICCPICGQEFKSEGGRNRHVTIDHPAKQNIQCLACKKLYGSAAAYMRHIEDNSCTHIKAYHFKQHRAERQLEQEARNMDPYGGGSGGSYMFTSRPPDPQQNNNNIPNPVGAPPAENERIHIGPGAAENLLDTVDANIDAQLHQEVRERLKPSIARFHDPITGLYVCPASNCDRKYQTIEHFAQHLQSGMHAVHQVKCPSCHKSFKTTSAFLSHCESGSVRCKIREAADYDKVLQEATAGILAVNGIMEDGSTSITAVAVEHW